MPTHGEVSNPRTEIVHGKPVVFRDQRSGEVIYDGPSTSTSLTVTDRYCGHCKNWIRVAGVMGFLRWISDHDAGLCSKDDELAAQPEAK